MDQNTPIMWPFGAPDVQSEDHAATVAVTVNNRKTFLTIGQHSAGATLDLTIADGLPVGSELIVRNSSDGTARTLTLGTGLEGNNITGTINKTKVSKFEYDGSNFVHVSTQQIDLLQKVARRK